MTIVRFRLVARRADDAIEKLRRLVEAGRWPEFADAVRLYEHGQEIDSFIPPAKPTSEA
jgi:hypothetical protein